VHHLRGVYGLVLVGLWLMLPPLAVGLSLTGVYGLVLGGFWLMLPPLAVGPSLTCVYGLVLGAFWLMLPPLAVGALFRAAFKAERRGLVALLRASRVWLLWVDFAPVSAVKSTRNRFGHLCLTFWVYFAPVSAVKSTRNFWFRP